jgi:hypothetical protein
VKKIILTLIVLVFLSACAPSAPSQGDIQTAIAQTEQALPTLTPTFIPTNTPEPTFTSVPTIAPSPTPDQRVIDGNPEDFLMQLEDLPKDAKYYLPNSTWISPLRNSEIVSGWGVDEGREYLEKTGRVDGWTVDYERGTKTVITPEEMYDNVVLYRTVDGAHLIITEYSNCSDPKSDFTELEIDFKIGDMTKACISRQMQSSGDNRVWYLIEFTYRNFYHSVGGWGWENEVRPEYVQDIARTLLAKLEAAPLSNEVTFSP